LSEQGDSAATRFERPAPVMFTRRCVGVVLLFGAGSLLVVHTSAQVNTNALPAGAKDSAAETNQMPPLPTVKSPVSVFRDLLHMSGAERKAFLADRSPQAQKQIMAKLREYESLRPNVRELRLRTTELSWYLLPILNTPATNRPGELALIPEEYRKSLEVRLQQWDTLPANEQQELLTNAPVIQYFVDLAAGPPNQTTISPARLKMLQSGVEQWQLLPEDRRREMLARFKQFFDLTPDEKRKALSTLSDAERNQMEKTLEAYSSLTPEQRVACISSFDKFTKLSVEERQQFLKNADRWKLMTPDERQAWRDLVNKLPPPFPVEIPMPPPTPTPGSSNPPVVTSGH
jgi:hypothetical protein